jgi:3-oxoacyl-[acyl-carrier protein] reductase
VTDRRVALVTGASRGIGRVIAAGLAADGFDLTVSARTPDTLEQAAAELRSSGRRVEAVPADMGVEDQVVALADAQRERYDRLDVLVLCAGTGAVGELATFPMRRVDRMLTINLRAPLLLVQQLMPALRATAAMQPELGSKIVAIASIAGMAADSGLAVYGATKAALISLCESIIVAEAETGVTATAISPGYVDTDMTSWLHDRIDRATMIRATDIAALVSAVSGLSRYAAVPNIAVTRPGTQLWRA